MITSRAETIVEKEERSLGDLLSQLASDTGNLIRQELRLAVAETRNNIANGVGSAAWLASGIVVAAGGALALLAAIILVLSIWLPAWLAAAIVGIALTAAGLILANYGLTALKNTEIVPDDSISSIKENTEWLKNQIKN